MLIQPYRTHKSTLNGTEFILAERYKIIKCIGTGAYGIVVSAIDTVTGQKAFHRMQVAIKKVPSWTNDIIDGKRVLREVRLLKFFDHENISSLYDMEAPSSPNGPPNMGGTGLSEDLNNVYIMTPLFEADLHKIIYSKQKLTSDHISYFIYQLLRALKYIHSSNVLHRDLKPSNLLVNSNCDLAVCDFGLSRGIHAEPVQLPPASVISPPDTNSESTVHSSNLNCSATNINTSASRELTEYVVTRWYRAPEIMLGCREYSKAVDMWSVGCILGELIRRKPLFAGSDYMDQLRLITSVIGAPAEGELKRFVKSERALTYMSRFDGTPHCDWTTFLRNGADPRAIDLLDKLICWTPSKRLTVDQALEHPLFSVLHCPSDEPSSSKLFDFSFEQQTLDATMLRKLMFQEVVELKNKISKQLSTAASNNIATNLNQENQAINSEPPSSRDFYTNRDSQNSQLSFQTSRGTARSDYLSSNPYDPSNNFGKQGYVSSKDSYAQTKGYNFPATSMTSNNIPIRQGTRSEHSSGIDNVSSNSGRNVPGTINRLPSSSSHTNPIHSGRSDSNKSVNGASNMLVPPIPLGMTQVSKTLNPHSAKNSIVPPIPGMGSGFMSPPPVSYRSARTAAATDSARAASIQAANAIYHSGSGNPNNNVILNVNAGNSSYSHGNLAQANRSMFGSSGESNRNSTRSSYSHTVPEGTTAGMVSGGSPKSQREYERKRKSGYSSR